MICRFLYYHSGLYVLNKHMEYHYLATLVIHTTIKYESIMKEKRSIRNTCQKNE